MSGIVKQLVDLTQKVYPDWNRFELSSYFLNRMDEPWNHFIVQEDGKIIGYMDWNYVSDTIIHITELICTSKGVIWKMRQHLYSMQWSRIMFKRHKTGKWIHIGMKQRRMSHV